MNIDEIRHIITNQISFNDWIFYLGMDDTRPYLQIHFYAKSNIGSCDKLELQTGRKWFLSHHMTRGEIVQTAFKAVLTALEHEAREQFLYCGRAIFGPHIDLDSLWEICHNKVVRDSPNPSDPNKVS